MKKKTVIYAIEDSRIICDIISRLVVFNPNLAISTFLNAETAIKEINKKVPDIIFLDYFLDNIDRSGKNGDHVLKYVKDNIPDIPVVLLTSLNDSAKINELIKIGFDGFIHKGEENLLDNMMDCINKFTDVEKQSLNNS